MRSRLFETLLCIATFAAATSPDPAHAQRFDCVLPAEMNSAGQCVAKVARDSSGTRIILRLVPSEGSAEGHTVTFQRTDGLSGSLTPEAKTGSTGLVETRWTGNPATGPVTFVATATVGGQQVSREVRIEQAPSQTALNLTLHSGNQQVWYEKRQLPRPIVVEVDGADANCTGAVVFFRPSSSGVASPDSAYALRETDPLTQRSACIARTFWKLGEGVGVQHLTASVRGNAARNVTAQARVRLLPRIGAGLAMTRFRAYRVPVVDTATSDTTVKRVSGDYLFRPTVSADFPVFRRVPGIRGSVGVSITSPDRDWYLGASIPQMFYGIPHEAMGVDVHVVAHVGRRFVLEDAADCEADRGCDSEDKVLVLGGGLMFVVDGATLLNTFTNFLKP